MAEPSSDEFDDATKRGKAILAGPRAESAHYDSDRNRVIVRLLSGIEIGFAPSDAEGLDRASKEELSEIELAPLGLGIHFPRLDADFYLPALLDGILGSKKWMAARLDVASAKAPASRRSSDKGESRPRKKTATS